MALTVHRPGEAGTPSAPSPSTTWKVSSRSDSSRRGEPALAGRPSASPTHEWSQGRRRRVSKLRGLRCETLLIRFGGTRIVMVVEGVRSLPAGREWTRRRSWASPAWGLVACFVWALVLGTCGRTAGPEPRRGQEEKIATTYANAQDVVVALRRAGLLCESVGPVASGTGQCQMAGNLLTIQVTSIGEQLPHPAPAELVTYWASAG